MSPALPLTDISPDQRYRVQSVDPADAAVERLMVLGLVEGAEIELASSAIGGDPIEFRLHGASISLRREHARFFRVALAD